MFFLELCILGAQMIFVFSLGLGVNPYCMEDMDFPVTKKSADPTDRQPYSLCSNRKSLSQQLDCPEGKATVRTEGGAPGKREEREGRGSNIKKKPSLEF
jgi:hypothetical protein